MRFEIVPGGHLGMLTGRAARGSTWRVLDEWVGQWSTTEAPTPAAKKAARKKAATKTEEVAPRSRRQEREEGGRQEAGREEPRRRRRRPARTSIGVNPTRRYGSAGSRSLAR